ncbi:MAG: hypothetical protein K8R88_14035 [Armatimonadetes bacterium]|nr:hypothetical protein [Armatimonadota bacterium]
MSLLALTLLNHLIQPIQIDYESRKGLVMSSGGVKLIQGSFFQFYAPGWTKGYYSSNWNDQEITRSTTGEITVKFASRQDEASGKIVITPVPGGADFRYEFNWQGAQPALVENTLGIVRATPFLAGKAVAGSDELPVGTPRSGDEKERQFFATMPSKFALASPFGKLSWTGSEPIMSIDGRGFASDWAQTGPAFWVGHQGIQVEKGKPAVVTAALRFTSSERVVSKEIAIAAKAIPTQKAAEPYTPNTVAKLKLEGKPKLNWRGVHLFVGPNSEGVHQRFAERVLPKLKINYVVLQCERTQWDALNGVKSSINTSKPALKRIFENYRKNGIEPIPLIQSFGHMEWLFAGGKNLELAQNPKVPYAINPENPAAVAKVFAIWDEAIDLLKPKWIHFGLDEVDMRGFPDDPKLTTRLWQVLLPKLSDYAVRNKKEMMLWGDKCLAPGQAPDAALGDNPIEAAARRSVVPKNAWITDWHYKDDARPSSYNNVKLWKQWGYKQIGSVWNRPKNVAGYTQAMIENGGEGMLQTIWAGYALSEESLLQNFGQYASSVLLADYAFSGRTEVPVNVGYSPEGVLQELYFGCATPASIPGSLLDLGTEKIPPTKIDRIRFAGRSPFVMGNIFARKNAVSHLSIDVNKSAAEAVFAFCLENQMDVGATIADIVIATNKGTVTRRLKYGIDVRSRDDLASTFRTPRTREWSLVSIVLPSTGKVEKISIKQLAPEAGLNIGGITLLNSARSW